MSSDRIHFLGGSLIYFVGFIRDFFKFLILFYFSNNTLKAHVIMILNKRYVENFKYRILTSLRFSELKAHLSSIKFSHSASGISFSILPSHFLP